MTSRTLIMAGASLLSVVMAMPAKAQTAAPAAAQADVQGSDGADTIIVTARRRDEDRQDVPSVVNAVTKEDIQKLNIRNFQEVQTLVPGLTLTTPANGTGGNASLRGVNFDVNASGFNGTVEFYYNDAPIQSGIMLQSLFDVGQIEVLRGPQGTLRGRASPSGSVVFSSRRPDLYQAGANVDATGTDLGTIQVRGGIGVPIIPGKLALRIAGVVDHGDGDRVHTINTSSLAFPPKNPYSDTDGGRITLRAEPFDALTLDGSYQHLTHNYLSYTQYSSFSEVNPAAPPSPVYIAKRQRESISNTPNTVGQTINIYNGQAQLNEAGQRLVYVFQHYSFHNHAITTQDPANRFPTAQILQDTDTQAEATSHELRLQNDARVAGMFDYVIGGLIINTNSPTNLINGTAVALPGFLGGGLAAVANTPIVRLGESHERSVFGNITAHIGDKFELSGGGRYIHFTSNGALIIGGTTNIADPNLKDNHFIYTASAKYNVTPDLMVYASTGSSYRPAINAVGDFSVNPSALERSFLSLPPETSRSYEIGFKSTFMDRRLRLNVTAYHQDFKNYPYRSQSGVYYVNYAQTAAGVTPQPSIFNFVAAVPVHVNGVEGEFGFAASHDWDVGLVASYSLGRIKNGLVPCTDLNGDGVPDSTTTAPTLAQLQAAVGANNIASCRVSQRSSFQSPVSFTLNSEYRHPLNAHLEGYLRGLFTFYGNSLDDPQLSYDDVRRYGLLNLYAGVRGQAGRWEVSLYAKNVANVDRAVTRGSPAATSFQELQPPAFRTTAGANFTSAYNIVTSTPPREIGITARWNFGSR
jgi:iron complex outermembrane receptor protein